MTCRLITRPTCENTGDAHATLTSRLQHKFAAATACRPAVHEETLQLAPSGAPSPRSWRRLRMIVRCVRPECV